MIRFWVADTLTGELVGQLRPSSWSWSEPVTGSSTGTLSIRVPQEAAAASRLADLVRPRRRQVIIEDTDTPPGLNPYVFAGPIPRRAAYDRSSGTLTVPIVDWRYWFYSALLRPSSWGGDSVHFGDLIVTNTDQALAMQWLMIAGLNTRATPYLVVDVPPSTGVLRDVTVRKLSRYIGEELDSIRDRNSDGTCDWYTYTTFDEPSSTFMAHVAVAWPQRAIRSEPLPLVVAGDRHGSWIDYTWPEGVDEPTRVFALGEGVPPAPVWAGDELPSLGSDDTTPLDEMDLCWELLAGPYEGVVKPSTCWADAHAILKQTGKVSGQATVTIPTSRVPLGALVAGDRARLRIVDPWLDVNLPAVRIIQRDVAGSQDQPSTQTLTLDLSDPVPLPVDNPGVVGDGN